MKTYGPALRVGGFLLATAALLPGWTGAQSPAQAASATAPVKSVSQVVVDRSGQQTVVHVNTRGGRGEVTYHTERLSNPPRIVLDVNSARLTAGTPVPSQQDPVRAVRLSQFQPAQVRVVIDLERPMGFYVEQQGQNLAVTFLEAASASNTPQAVTALAKTAASQSPEFSLPANLTGKGQVLASPAQSPVVPVSAALAPQAPAAAPQGQPAPAAAAQRFTGEPISVDLRDVDLKDFFRLIHEISGLNVVLDPTVRGNVTLVLDEVPWDQALDIVMRNNGLTKDLDGNVLRIATRDTVKKEAEDRQALAKAETDAIPTETTTRVLSYAKAADVSTTLRRFLSPRGDIFFDERSNTMIIRDIPASLPQLDNLIRQLDRKAQQVEIEARVVLASRNFARDIGTQLAFATGPGNHVIGGDTDVGTSNLSRTIHAANGPNGTPLPGVPRDPIPPLIVGNGATSFPANVQMPLATNFPAVAATSGITYAFSSANFFLDAFITAAEARGVGKLLSSPKLVAQNNAKATVKQGTKIPIQTSVNNTVSVQYVDAVLQLVVTPQITADGTVFMDVLVENTSVDPGIDRVQGIPALATQSAETKTTIGDGGTVVIGGVIVSSQRTDVQQVPLVGSVPLIGHLFKRNAVAVSSQELLFFITPRIQPG